MSVIDINIFGRKLPVHTGDLNEEYLLELASYVDETINAVKDRNENYDDTVIAILACVNIADILLSSHDDEEKKEAFEKLKTLSERSKYLIEMIDEASGK